MNQWFLIQIIIFYCVIILLMEQKLNNVRDKLLIIDDDQATRLLIKVIVNDIKITTIETGCGREALDLFSKFSKEIFLVILDIRLPGYNGWTLFDKFRKIDPKVPVIAISATFPLELALQSEQAGMAGYISKPFWIDELRQIIRSYYGSLINDSDELLKPDFKF